MALEERDLKWCLGSNFVLEPAVDAPIMVDSDNLCQNDSQKSLADPLNFSENTRVRNRESRKNRSRAPGISPKIHRVAAAKIALQQPGSGTVGGRLMDTGGCTIGMCAGNN